MARRRLVDLQDEATMIKGEGSPYYTDESLRGRKTAIRAAYWADS